MAALDFTQDGGRWVAEATVHGDYCLHVERKEGGEFFMFQRSTSSGQYKNCPPSGTDTVQRRTGY